MRGWVIMLGITFALVVLLSAGLYVSVAHGFKSLSNSISNGNWTIDFVSGKDSETVSQSYPLNRDGKVSIKTTNGSIIITSHDKDEAVIKIIKEGTKEDFPFVEANINSSPTNLTIKTSYKKNSCHASISYELALPKNASVTARTTNGAIKVMGLKGQINAQSSNGSITLEDTPAILNAETTNGRISVNADVITAQPTPITIETTNGSISFVARSLEKNSLSLETVNGSVRVALPEVPDEKRTKSGDALDSMINSMMPGKQRSFSISATGGGVASFEIETVNGSISVEKAGE